MDHRPRLPWWLLPISRANGLLVKIGFPLFGQCIVSAPGVRSGLRRETVIWPLEIAGVRYVLAGPRRAWVDNVEAASWEAELVERRRRRRVTFTLVPAIDREPVLRRFWQRVPGQAPFVQQAFDLPRGASMDDLVAQADRFPVFRINPSSG